MQRKKQSLNSISGVSSKSSDAPLDVGTVPLKLLETIHFLSVLQTDAALPDAVRTEAGAHIEGLRACVHSIAAAAEQLAEVA
jgi:hypothetical protein